VSEQVHKAAGDRSPDVNLDEERPKDNGKTSMGEHVCSSRCAHAVQLEDIALEDERRVDPTVLGKSRGEDRPGLPRGNTAQLVDGILQQRRKAVIAGAVQAFLGVIVLVLDVVGVVVKADDENCDASPLEWGRFFLVHAIAVGAAMIANWAMLYGVMLMVNRDLVTGTVHRAKGAELEARREIQAGAAQAQTGMKLTMIVGCCGLFPIIIFMLVWFIMGVVTYFNSDGSACEEAKTWFWMIIVANIAMQSIGSAMKPKQPQI